MVTGCRVFRSALGNECASHVALGDLPLVGDEVKRSAAYKRGVEGIVRMMLGAVATPDGRRRIIGPIITGRLDAVVAITAHSFGTTQAQVKRDINALIYAAINDSKKRDPVAWEKALAKAKRRGDRKPLCTCNASEANRALGNHFDDCPLR